jgi:hypothetical protein
MKQISYIPKGTRVYYVCQETIKDDCPCCDNGNFVDKQGNSHSCNYCDGEGTRIVWENGHQKCQPIIKTFMVDDIWISSPPHKGFGFIIRYGGIANKPFDGYSARVDIDADKIYLTEEEALNNLEA